MIEIVRVAFDDPEALPLVAQQVQDQAARRGITPWPIGNPDEYVAPVGGFLLARIDGVAVGCGGLRRMRHDPSVGEVKRLWTAPHARRQGVAQALLDELEGPLASELGFAELILSTAEVSHEAIALYTARGWEPIENDPAFGFWKRALVYRRTPRPFSLD